MMFAFTLFVVLALSSGYLFHQWLSDDLREHRP